MRTTITAICQYLVKLLNDNSKSLGLQKVYYGDQAKLFATKVACVEAQEKVSELYQVNRTVRNTLKVNVYCYSGSVENVINNRERTDALADSVEQLLNESVDLGGLVIHAYVSKVSHGYASKVDGIVQSAEIEVTAEWTEKLKDQL